MGKLEQAQQKLLLAKFTCGAREPKQLHLLFRYQKHTEKKHAPAGVCMFDEVCVADELRYFISRVLLLLVIVK